MLLTNHVLTGALLGLAIDNPYVLAPTAVASHLVLDMTPHFGYITAKNGAQTRAPMFIMLGALDFPAALAVTAAACLAWPSRLPSILIGVLGATLPDLVYIPPIALGPRRAFRLPGYEALIKFLARIQWSETPLGLITEVIWAALMLRLLQGQLP
jgi:hypothetical protein